MRCRSLSVWLVLGVAVCAAVPAAWAQSPRAPSLHSWLEMDRQAYGPADDVRVALCLRNQAAEDIGMFVDEASPRVTVDGVEVPLGTVRPSAEPRELIVPRGETRVLACTVPIASLGLPLGTHHITATVQPVGGDAITAEGAFELLPLQQGLTVADLLGAPNVWQSGDVVEVKGEYRANASRPLRPLAGVRPHRLTDWILGDETGEVFVRNRPVAEGNAPHSAQVADVEEHVDLNPGWSYGKRVVVRARVAHDPDGSLVLDPLSIFKWQSDRGAFCVLETSRPTQAGEHVGELMMRMIFKNDTKYPIRIASPAGYLCDFVVERDGTEVWRWSRHRWTGAGIRWTRVEDDSWKLREKGEGEEDQTGEIRGLPILNVPPDNSIVRVAYWPLVDNDGEPVPSGVYMVSAILSHRVFTYAVPVEVGSPRSEQR